MDTTEFRAAAIWLVLITSWLSVMTLLFGPMIGNSFFNLLFTLGHQVGYFDTVWGIGIIMMFLMAIDVTRYRGST